MKGLWWRLCGACALLAASAPADAEVTGRDSQPTRVSVFVIPGGKPLSAARHATLLLTMERAVARDLRLEVVDKDLELSRRRGAVPEAEVDEARALACR